MAKPVATGLLDIKLSKPCAAKWAANMAMKRCFLHRTDEARNKTETRVCSYLAPCKTHLFIIIMSNLTSPPFQSEVMFTSYAGLSWSVLIKSNIEG